MINKLYKRNKLIYNSIWIFLTFLIVLVDQFTKNLVVKKVNIIPNNMTPVKYKADITLSNTLLAVTKNIEISAIIVGNFPLQGTKLFVITAKSLSLFESIILHPVTPTALHPKPIHIVRACFPQLLHFLKGLSRLKAILGK